MKPIVLNDIKFEPDTAAIAKKLHIEPGSEEYGELLALIESAAKAAKPKAIYKPVFVEDIGKDFVLLGDQRMMSTVIPKNLKDIRRVFAYVATCGEEIVQYAKNTADFLHVWWLDTIMEFALRAAVSHLQDRVKKDFGLNKTASMSPGSLPDWPIEEQKKLFSLIGDVKGLIGVTLTDTMLMLPVKTVSGFYFETQTDYVNCQLCPRENCLGRREPFDEAKYKKVFGS